MMIRSKLIPIYSSSFEKSKSYYITLINSKLFNKQKYLHFNSSFNSWENTNVLSEPTTSIDDFGQPSDNPFLKIEIKQQGINEISENKTTQRYQYKNNIFIESEEELQITNSVKNTFPRKKNSRFSIAGYEIDNSLNKNFFWEEIRQKETSKNIIKFKNFDNKFSFNLNKDRPRKRLKDTKTSSENNKNKYNLESFNNIDNKSKGTEFIQNLENFSIKGQIGTFDSTKTILDSNEFNPPINTSQLGSGSYTTSLMTQNPDYHAAYLNLKSISTPIQVLNWFDQKSKILPSHIYTTILSRISSLTNNTTRNVIIQHPQFFSLIKALETNLYNFDGQQLGSILHSLVRLNYTPDWINLLLEHCIANIKSLDFSSLSNCICTCFQIPIVSQSSKSLTEALLNDLDKRLKNHTLDLSELIILIKSLGWARTVPNSLLDKLSDKIKPLINKLDNRQLLITIRTFAKLNSKDHHFAKEISNIVTKNIHEFNAQEIVKIVWGISKMGFNYEDFYLLFISPTLRTFLPKFNSKELSVILKSYVNAQIIDHDLFHDVVNHLQPHIDQLLPDELSEICSSLVRVNYQNKQFYESLKNRSLKLSKSFTPVKLVKNIYALSLSGVLDAKYYFIMCNQVIDSISILKAPYLFRILHSLYLVEYLSHPIVSIIFDQLIKLDMKLLFVEESLIALRCLIKLNLHTSKEFFIQKILYSFYQRENVWRCLTKPQVIEILNLLNHIKLYDQNFLSLLYRRFHRFIGGPDSQNFFDMTKAFISLPYYQIHLLKIQVINQSEIFNTLALSILNFYNSTSFNEKEQIELLFYMAKLGFESDITKKLFDDIINKISNNPFLVSYDTLSLFLWALFQTKYNLTWANNILTKILSSLVYFENMIELDLKKIQPFENLKNKDFQLETNVISPYSMVLITWCSLASSKKTDFYKLFPYITKFYSKKFPQEIELAQQFSYDLVHLSDFLKPASYIIKWAQEMLNYTTFYNHQRIDKFNSKKWNNDILNYLSQELILMKIPHQKMYSVTNTYWFSISIPSKKILIDVLNVMDIKIKYHDNQINNEDRLMTTEIRQKQVAQHGWHIHSITPKELELFKENNQIRQFLEAILFDINK